MKNKFFILTSIISGAIFFATLSVCAQAITDYYLLPGSEMIAPIGSSINFELYREDGIIGPQLGTSVQFVEGIPPAWTLNGQSPNTPANTEGRLSSDLTFDKATYHAPDKVPKINPVTVVVKFKANDSTKEEVTLVCNITIVDPGQNWYFSYSGFNSSGKTITSPFHQLTERSSASGSMIIDAMPPQDGDAIINTEQGDKVLKSFVGGLYNYYKMETHEDANKDVSDKRLSIYSGKPETSQSLLFEYNSKDEGDQGGIQGAGVSYDVKGTDELWNRDVNGQLRKASNQVNEKSWAGLSLGHKEDKVSKIKNGFAIDYSQSKDTSYTDVEGEKYTLKSIEQYHAELTKVNKK